MVRSHERAKLEAMDRHGVLSVCRNVDCFHTTFLSRRLDWRSGGRRIFCRDRPIYSGAMAKAANGAADVRDPRADRCALDFIVHRKSPPQRSTSLNVTGDRRYRTHLGALLALLKGYGRTMAASPPTVRLALSS